MKPNVVSFDTETHLIKPGLLVPKMVCGTFADDDSPFKTTLVLGAKDQTPNWAQARAVLVGPKDTADVLGHHLKRGHHIVCQNAPFDMAVAMREDPSLVTLIFEAYDEGRIHDTMIREMLNDIARGCLGIDPDTRKPFRYNQASLEKRHLGIDRTDAKTNPDAWRLRYAELDGVPLAQWPKEAVIYPLEDAENCLALFHKQDGFQNLNDEAAQVRAHFALHLGAAWGIRTNPDAVREFTNRVLTQQRLDQEKFHLAGIYRKEKNGKYVKDTKALAAKVTLAYGGNPPTTPSGAVATDKDTLIESGDDLLTELAETSANNKLANSYTKGLAHGTRHAMTLKPNPLLETGRTSYRAGAEDMTVNPQVFPRKGGVRECIEARPGRVLVSVDYSTQELRTLAQVCLWAVGYSDMADALNAKRDLHTALAAKIMGESYDKAVALVKAKDKKAKDFRQMAKPVNFGLPGGMGPPTLVFSARNSYGVRFCELSGQCEKCGTQGKVTQWGKKEITPTCKVCLDVAAMLKDEWMTQWSEMQGYFSWVKSQITLHDGITHYVSERFRGGVGFCDGANGGFQGLAADMSKAALWLVTRDCYAHPDSPLYGTRVPAFIHDELLCEVPEPRLHEAAYKVADHMRTAAQAYCPDIDPGALEPAAMRWWYKEAETVLDKNGRLIPWEPKP